MLSLTVFGMAVTKEEHFTEPTFRGKLRWEPGFNKNRLWLAVVLESALSYFNSRCKITERNGTHAIIIIDSARGMSVT